MAVADESTPRRPPKFPDRPGPAYRAGPFNHERKVRVSVQLCNPQRVVGQIGLLANHATEIVRVGKDNVGGDVILFGQFKSEASAAVVVGPITKRQVRQPVGACCR